MKLIISLCIIMLLLCPTNVNSAKITTIDDGSAIRIDGMIESPDTNKIINAIKKMADGRKDQGEARTIHFNCPDGDYAACADIGRTIYDNYISTVVDSGKKCNNGCIIAFLGGRHSYGVSSTVTERSMTSEAKAEINLDRVNVDKNTLLKLYEYLAHVDVSPIAMNIIFNPKRPTLEINNNSVMVEILDIIAYSSSKFSAKQAANKICNAYLKSCNWTNENTDLSTVDAREMKVGEYIMEMSDLYVKAFMDDNNIERDYDKPLAINPVISRAFYDQLVKSKTLPDLISPETEKIFKVTGEFIATVGRNPSYYLFIGEELNAMKCFTANPSMDMCEKVKEGFLNVSSLSPFDNNGTLVIDYAKF